MNTMLNVEIIRRVSHLDRCEVIFAIEAAGRAVRVHRACESNDRWASYYDAPVCEARCTPDMARKTLEVLGFTVVELGVAVPLNYENSAA